tara:strand:+ start:729 stop:1424 length:696 start_codon:yes stop_codon:yes gene_type:complete
MKFSKINTNIAPEGHKIILYSLIIWLIICSFLIYLNYAWTALLSLFLISSICYFFRDPNRENICNKKLFFSPADGKILSIKKHIDADIGESKKIAIFLSFFNVHRQWVPIDATVLNVFYNSGNFFGAYRNKASLKNEQSVILFQNNNNNIFKIKQIAGLVARRIVNHMNTNVKVCQGQKLGFIKFGSRVEIIVPNNFDIKVKKGMKVKGCKTIIGEFTKKSREVQNRTSNL